MTSVRRTSVGWDQYKLEPLGERSLDGLVDMTDAYHEAAEALGQLSQIAKWPLAPIDNECPKDLTLGWKDNRRGYQVMRGEVLSIIQEQWKSLIALAHQRLHEKANAAVLKTRQAPPRSREDIDQ